MSASVHVECVKGDHEQRQSDGDAEQRVPACCVGTVLADHDVIDHDRAQDERDV